MRLLAAPSPFIINLNLFSGIAGWSGLHLIVTATYKCRGAGHLKEWRFHSSGHVINGINRSQKKLAVITDQ
jgi:hypothetical protein